MKYLSHYVQEAQTKLLNETGAFFAFSVAQFNESKKENVPYVHLGHGTFCPKENADKLVAGLKQIQQAGIDQDIAENGKDRIIERELHNYEAFYVNSLRDTCDALKPYGITRDEIAAVYSKLAPTIEH